MKIEEAVRKHKLIYLGVGEPALRRQAFAEIFRTFELTPKDFDVTTFENGANSVAWISEAGIAPFFADRRIVVVRNVFSGDSKTADVNAVKGLPDSGLIVLLVDDDAGDHILADLTPDNTVFFKIAEPKKESEDTKELVTH